MSTQPIDEPWDQDHMCPALVHSYSIENQHLLLKRMMQGLEKKKLGHTSLLTGIKIVLFL